MVVIAVPAMTSISDHILHPHDESVVADNNVNAADPGATLRAMVGKLEENTSGKNNKSLIKYEFI